MGGYFMSGAPGGGDGLTEPAITPGGRLSLFPTVPASTANESSTTVYYVPYTSQYIQLYTGSGSVWALRDFTGAQVAVPSGTELPFDIFASWDGAAVVMETVNWTDASNRATELSTQDNRKVKDGEPEKLYLGTASTGVLAGNVEDSTDERLLFNQYNRVFRELLRAESNNSWTYAVATWRQANASAANRVRIVSGTQEMLVSLDLLAMSANTGLNRSSVGIGDNITTSPSGNCLANWTAHDVATGGRRQMFASYRRVVPVGLRTYNWLEIGHATGAQTFYGSESGSRSGLSGYAFM